MILRLDLAQKVLPYVCRRLLLRATRGRTHRCFRRGSLEDGLGGGRPACTGRLHRDFTMALLGQSLRLDCYVTLQGLVKHKVRLDCQSGRGIHTLYRLSFWHF